MEAFCIGINPDFESTGKLFEIGTINLDGIGALIIGPNMQARKADLLKVIITSYTIPRTLTVTGNSEIFIYQE